MLIIKKKKYTRVPELQWRECVLKDRKKKKKVYKGT